MKVRKGIFRHLADLRMRAGISKVTLATQANISTSTMIRAERGVPVRLETCYKIHIALANSGAIPADRSPNDFIEEIQ